MRRARTTRRRGDLSSFGCRRNGDHETVSATAGLADPAIALELEPLRAALGAKPNWRARYRACIEQIDDA
jgi:hypothetical protein